MKQLITFCFCIGLFSSNVKSQLTGDTSIGVRLSTFNASKNNNDVKLNWKVACRISYARFEVQRSTDGINFSTINSFQADYLRCLQPFDYTDILAFGQVFYRIKVGDIDGRFSIEKVVKVAGKAISDTEIRIISPVTGNFLQLTVAANNNENIGLQVLNISGNILQTLNISPGKGINQMEIPFNNSQAGIYILSYQMAGIKKSVRFVKSN
ncbi:MAG: T9SS type A sorting domain-containing protein [Bacteroidota bacterium]|nr:T9SS type A sorting domain-containing protein [Bacteroidota bacterium]